MKTIVKIALASLLTLSFSQSYAQWGQKKVVGNGNVTTKTISTGDYDSIKGVGSLDIHLVKGVEGTISVTTDENLHEYLEIEVNNNELVIKVKNNYNLKSKKGIHISVPFEDINSLSMVGSGDIDTKDTIKADTFEVNVTGSGDIEVSLDTNSLQAKVTGSGDITLAGNTKMLDVTVTGSGDFKGYDLISDITDVEVSGSGDAKVYAKESIKARVSGSGDISYKGNPERKDTKTAGSGNISSN
jgi:Putative auto-transporter adhesin, head GIN domain